MRRIVLGLSATKMVPHFRFKTGCHLCTLFASSATFALLLDLYEGAERER